MCKGAGSVNNGTSDGSFEESIKNDVYARYDDDVDEGGETANDFTM